MLQYLHPVVVLDGVLLYDFASSAPPPNTPTPKKRTRHEQQHEDRLYVKKPPNAFMLFLKEQRPKVMAELNISGSPAVNGEKWKSLTKAQQAKYYKQAEEERMLHTQQHPEWSSKDNYGKKRRRVRASTCSTGVDQLFFCHGVVQMFWYDMWSCCSPAGFSWIKTIDSTTDEVLDPARPIKPLPPTVKFLKQPRLPPAAAPASQPVPATSQSSLTQEQLIQQQLLSKQKQLELKMGEDKEKELKENASSNSQKHSRKRTRSPSGSRSPVGSPKREDKRSLKRRAHSSSSSLSPLLEAGKVTKAGKSQRLEPPHSEPSCLSPIPRFESESSKHSDRFPGHTPPHNRGYPPSQYNGPPHRNMTEWVNSPRHMTHGPLRGGQSIGRFDGPPQGPDRFGGPIGQQLPVRYEGQGPGPGLGHPECPMQRFVAPRHFNSMGPGPGPGPGPASAPMGFQQRPSCFNGRLRFDGPGHVEGPCQPGPQYHVLHLNLQFPTPSVLPGQQNIHPVGNFDMQPQIGQPEPPTLYNPAAPAVGLQKPVMGNRNQPFPPQNPVSFPPQNPVSFPPQNPVSFPPQNPVFFPQQNLQVSPPENHLSSSDVDNLLSQLLSTGVIRPSQPEAVPASSSESSSAPPAAPEELTSFSPDKLKQCDDGVVTVVYSGKQCFQCSMCFPATQNSEYAKHLDWHFRQNHETKVACRKGPRSVFFEREKQERKDIEVEKQKQKEKEQLLSVSATKGKVEECCETCQDTFDTYWDEEREDWFLKNTIKVDGKNFHPGCYEDYKTNTLPYLDDTPSPASC